MIRSARTNWNIHPSASKQPSFCRFTASSGAASRASFGGGSGFFLGNSDGDGFGGLSEAPGPKRRTSSAESASIATGLFMNMSRNGLVPAMSSRDRLASAGLSVDAADNLHIGGVDNFVVVVGASAAGVRMVVSDVDQFCDGALRSGDYFYIEAAASCWSGCG